MKKLVIVLLVLLSFASALMAVDFKVSGVYTAWAQTQNQFWLGKRTAGDEGFKYEENYFVQMLRFNVQAAVSEHLMAVTRFDIAQGWWGVDNALRSVQRPYGSYGGSSLFDFKDTNFLLHVDQAYVAFRLNDTFGGRVGRMWYGIGNKIMMDNNYDGIQLDLHNVIGNRVTFSYAKVSENGDNTNDQQIGTVDNRDADLFSLNLSTSGMEGDLALDVFGFYYKDQSVKDGVAFVPDGLQFFKTRFSPQVTTLMAFGAAASYKKGKLYLKGEFDYLTGKDDIVNKNDAGETIHGAKQMWDINDGNLSGFNLYLNATYAATDVLSVGGVIGMGSGDDDVTKGKGNVNKLRTSGFFYITEVWEDSIMPDEEGITPQGLGGPNVRGYRELENSTIVQLNATIKPFPKFSTFLSYNYIAATNAVHAWTATEDGAVIDPSTKSTALGQEIDFRFNYQMMEHMGVGLRGGYFMPGDAAGYLINGTNKWLDAAWELKGTILYKF